MHEEARNLGPKFINILPVATNYFFALDTGKMISFVVSHMITVLPYSIMDYCDLIFEIDISDHEDNYPP